MVRETVTDDASGIMMVVKILNSPAPSSLADSARDSGMDMKCWRYMNIPVVVVTTGRIDQNQHRACPAVIHPQNLSNRSRRQHHRSTGKQTDLPVEPFRPAHKPQPHQTDGQGPIDILDLRLKQRPRDGHVKGNLRDRSTC